MSQTNTYSDLRVFGEIKAGQLTIAGEYSLPTTDGLANQILVTDGSGNISFQDASSVALTPPSIIDGTGLTWTIVSPTTIRGDVSLAPFTTDDLAEGTTNLYFQDEYVDDRVNALIINGTGITKVYNDLANTLTIGVTLAPFSTTNLAEGVNLYYTDERVEDRMAAVLYKGGRGTGPDAITWTHVDGLDRIYPTVSLTPFSTDDLAEGTTNLYLTENSLYDLMDTIIQDSASVTWTRNNLTNQLTATAAGSTLAVQLDGTPIASNPTIDFISTPSIALTINDDIINSKTTIQIATTADDAVVIEGFGSGSSVRKNNLNNSIGSYSTVSGGLGNTASGDYSAIAGGTCNSITSVGSFVGGGTNHNVSGDGAAASVSPVSSGPFAGAIDGLYFPTTTSSGLGTGQIIAVQIVSNMLNGWQTVGLGINYAVGDTITIDGADIGGVSGVDDIIFTVDATVDGGSTVAGGFNNDAFGVLNSISGGLNNLICGHASTISGGDSHSINGIGIFDFAANSTISGGSCNIICGYTHAIGGGVENTISGLNASTIAGGDTNSIVIPFGLDQNGFSTIAGGASNSILSSHSAIGGGRQNLVCGQYGTIAGGYQNEASGPSDSIVNFSSYSITSPIADGTYVDYPTGGSGSGALVLMTIQSSSINFLLVIDGGSGYQTGDVLSWTVGSPGSIDLTVGTVLSGSSAILGGTNNYVNALGSTIGGGSYNCICTAPYSTIDGGINNAITSGYAATVGGGISNTISGYFALVSTVSGGYGNTATCANSTIAGGVENSVTEINSMIGGGLQNSILSKNSTISGGSGNTISICSDRSTIGGGYQNEVYAESSVVGGGELNCACGFASTVSGGYCNIAECDYSVIVGGLLNSAIGNGSIVGGVCSVSSGINSTAIGGYQNSATAIRSTVSGGQANTASGSYSTIGGGTYNSATRFASAVSGGWCNLAGSPYSIVGGGCDNTAGTAVETSYIFVGGGRSNYAHGTCATISGGFCNEVSGYSPTIAGGSCNTVSGNYSAVLGGNCNSVTHNYASAVGCNISSVCANTFHTNCLNLYDTPNHGQCTTTFLVRESNGMVNYRVYGGLFAQTAQSSTITATATETSLITTGLGTLSVPANGFSVGDSFTARLAGTLSAANNETLRVRVKSGSVLLADTGAITLPTITSKYWQLDIGFTIRAIGAAGVAIISSNGLLSYTQNSGSSHEGIGFDTINNTTFDTTGTNTLTVTAQWGSSNASNSIFSSSFVLHKTF